MSDLDAIPFPTSLCVQLLFFAAHSCTQTQDKRATEIKAAAAFFFTDKEISDAVKHLSGEPV